MSTSDPPPPDPPYFPNEPETPPLARVVRRDNRSILIINARALRVDSINTQTATRSHCSDRGKQPAGSSPQTLRTSTKRKAASQPAPLAYKSEYLQSGLSHTAEPPRKRHKTLNPPTIISEQSSSSNPSRRSSVAPSTSPTRTTPDAPDSTQVNSSAKDSAAQGVFERSSHPAGLNRPQAPSYSHVGQYNSTQPSTSPGALKRTSAFSAWGRDHLLPAKYIDQESGETATPSDPGLTPEGHRQTSAYFSHYPLGNPLIHSHISEELQLPGGIHPKIAQTISKTKRSRSTTPEVSDAGLYTMTENIPPAGATGDLPGQPYYEKTRKHLKELLQKKASLANSLANLEDQIYKKETEYLEETPSGNIITGFENYTKGTSTGVGGGRKRGNAVDGNRVFSKSSISYNPNAESPIPSAQSTPVAAMAPTPLSTTFLKGEGASNHATPTSATSANKTGAGLKKKKKDAGDDSETDTKEGKKARTNFGAARK